MTPAFFSFGRRRERAAKESAEKTSAAAESATAAPQKIVPAGEAAAPVAATGDEAATSDADELGEAAAKTVADASANAATGAAEATGRETTKKPAVNSEEPVEQALAKWRQELVDLGGVASADDVALLAGAVDLTQAHPSGLAQLYAGRPTHLSSLVREHSALAVARQSLRQLAARTDLLARQFGVAPVYLALGVASWSETEAAAPVEAELDVDADAADANEDKANSSLDAIAAAQPEVAEAVASAADTFTQTINAPILLRPLHLASTGADASLTLSASIEINPVFARALRTAGCSTDVEAIARACLSNVGFTPRAALTRLGALGRQYLTDFKIQERLIVGAFVHPGQALVEDFDATIERARASALVAALAGDVAARAALQVELPPGNPADRQPARERGVGDLDPAQLDAIEAVSTGASILLDAPPGSDTAATLAAIMADAAACGRTVLHVPATSADGHAVAGALRELGLADLVIDLTEDPDWRLHAAEAIKASLGVRAPELDVEAIVDLREQLETLRHSLYAAIDALHAVRQPWNVSAYDALEQLARFTAGSSRHRTKARVQDAALTRLDADGLKEALELLQRAGSLDLLQPQITNSAWKGVKVADIDEATDALTHLTKLADELLPAIQDAAANVSARIGITRARSLNQWCAQLDMLAGVRESLDVFLPEVFERSAADMVIATATSQWRKERSIEMSAASRRRFLKQVKDLVRPGRPVEDLHAELVKVQHRREAWRSFNPTAAWPQLPQRLDEMQAIAAAARAAVEAVQPLLTGLDGEPLAELELVDLWQRVQALAADDLTAQNLPEINRVIARLNYLGLGDLFTDLARRQVSGSDLEEELNYCWWASILSYLLRTDPHLAGLDRAALGERAQVLRSLDLAHCHSLCGPVLQAYSRHVRNGVQADKNMARDLYVALTRDDGVPLRELLAAYPLALVAKPVWIIPPTLVPQVLTPDASIDLAILDASTHLPVSQVLPAFVRAQQVLVVGDSRRHVPGLASELGALLPAVTLPTNRNALEASVAAFLAAHGYAQVVEAIPSPPGACRLTLELVEGRGMPAPGQTAVESVPAEVDRVVDLVIEHALVRPELSLGVVALNARHAEQINHAITAAVSGSPALEEFFTGGIAEPFVVVDLSEARSLRRDRIILSVGYAKTPHGRTIHNFGAVSQPGGMVSLVEALCASRGDTQIVSCLSYADIDPERLHAPGAQLLRQVLQRASGENCYYPQGSETYPEQLLVDLAERLWRKGLIVVPRYGVEGGVRIPLAIGHPDYPEELTVAVLSDDATYAAEPSLRRRDRHWIERLQQRGWRVYMAFSVAVFIDPEAEADAIEQLVLAALQERHGAAVNAPAVQEPATEVAPVRRDESAENAAAAAPVRAERPPIAQGLPLQAYSDDQLDDLVAWIRSDAVERTVEAEVEELRSALALQRRGAGADAVLTHAVERTRSDVEK